MVRPSASNLTGWQRRRVKAKASALLAALTQRLVGREGGVFSPSCDASHLHPAPLQQHQAAQGRPGHHSSSAACSVLLARADRLLLGSDLPRGSLGAAPALGRLGPSPAGGLRPSTHSRLLGLRGSGRGEHQKGMTHTAMPGQQAGRAPCNTRTLAGVQQSEPAGCRYTAGRISSEQVAWHSSIARGASRAVHRTR